MQSRPRMSQPVSAPRRGPRSAERVLRSLRERHPPEFALSAQLVVSYLAAIETGADRRSVGATHAAHFCADAACTRAPMLCMRVCRRLCVRGSASNQHRFLRHSIRGQCVYGVVQRRHIMHTGRRRTAGWYTICPFGARTGTNCTPAGNGFAFCGACAARPLQCC